MNQKYTLSSVLCLALFLTVGCVSARGMAQDQAANGSRAMHDWETGKSVAYNVVRSQKQSLEIPGQGVQENESSVSMDVSITSTGSRQFDLVVTSAEITGSPLSADSIIGLESGLVLDSRGRITSASGLDDNSFVTSSGGPEQFREDLQEIFLILPDGPLAAGISWTDASSVPFLQQGITGTRESMATYTCKQKTTFEGTPAFEVEYSSDVSLIASGDQGGGEMDITMEGTLSGTIFVDATSGSLLSSDVKGNIAGVIDMAMGALPMTLEISLLTTVAK